jgi:hypothetical protein
MYYFTDVEMFDTTKRIVMFKDDDNTLWSIPDDPANTDYREYLAWVAEGNTPKPWQPEIENVALTAEGEQDASQKQE